MYMFTQPQQHRGVTLLIAVLVVSIVLSIGLAILNITLKEFILSGVARDSAVAFTAADAGLECGKYWDRSPSLPSGSVFDTTEDTSVDCFEGTYNTTHTFGCEYGGAADCYSHEIELVDFGEGGTPLCTSVLVTKFQSSDGAVQMTEDRACPQGFRCTTIEARGYNDTCTGIDSSLTVERAIRANYGGCRIGSCP